MEIKNMAAVERAGTSSGLKEQYEKQEKFVARDFIFSPQKQKGGSAER